MKDPIQLTDQWLEIQLAEPIEIAPRYHLLLVHSGKLKFKDHSAPVSPTGKQIRIQAELRDMDGRLLPLVFWGYAFGFSEGDGLTFGSLEIQVGRKFKTLRLRSEPDVTIVRVSWTRSLV
jgi:hypothetical protein